MMMPWRSKVLRVLIDPYFHLKVRSSPRSIGTPDGLGIVHPAGPISPLAPRFLAERFRNLAGPLNGNIGYPPGSRMRQAHARISGRVHLWLQRALRVSFAEKRRYERVPVAGGDRTRASLRAAGCRDAQMTDTVDAGLPDAMVRTPCVAHTGTNGRFACTGRFVDGKGFDLAIRSVARTDPAIMLDLYGDGLRPRRERLHPDQCHRSLGARLRDRTQARGRSGP